MTKINQSAPEIATNNTNLNVTHVVTFIRCHIPTGSYALEQIQSISATCVSAAPSLSLTFTSSGNVLTDNNQLNKCPFVRQNSCNFFYFTCVVLFLGTGLCSKLQTIPPILKTSGLKHSGLKNPIHVCTQLMVTNDKTNPFFLFCTESYSLELKLFILSTYSAWIISLLLICEEVLASQNRLSPWWGSW